MRYSIFDIETDGLLDKLTKLHCLSFRTYNSGVLEREGSFTTLEGVRHFMTSGDEVLIGHNILRYDIPALSKLLNCADFNRNYIDTLGLSWYLYPMKKKHGLEVWGEEFGVPKPIIDDWESLSIEEYKNRCQEDVKINSELFHMQFDYLNSIYSGNMDNIQRIINYINFKLDCLKEQEEVGIFLNKQLCAETKLDLEFILEEKIDNLKEAMPQSVANVLKAKPKKPYKKDGSLSSHGERWYKLLEDKNLPEDTEIIYEEPNPGSNTQLKKWLFSIGWEPETFKISKATGQPVPQVSLPFGGGICDSIKSLYNKVPELVELEGFYVAKHRLGILKSFEDSVDENGYMYASAHGFTNTMRLQHSKPIVNLPGVFKDYGKEIRGCLTVPSDDYIMFGSDVSSLEDNTKQHYIYFFDPEYVKEMRVPGFDPHLDIALVANMVTQEEVELYKDIDSAEEGVIFPDGDMIKFKKIKEIRGDAKVVNFSATYGAGAAKIASTLKKPLEAGQALHNTYWKRNAAVKKTADSCIVRSFNKQKWLYNPVSGFWMFLKEDKDKFSTLNQSTGVYVFDTWLRKSRQKLIERGIKVCLQYHDELLGYCLIVHKNFVTQALKDAMKETNEEIQLNVEIGISVDWGDSYAECH